MLSGLVEIVRDTMTFPVIFRRWPRPSGKPDVCCAQCDEAGRTTYDDRMRYHLREMRRGANISIGALAVALVTMAVAILGVVVSCG